jgi:ubiquinone/menaquinone biosynthesis C-methylase UbiE
VEGVLELLGLPAGANILDLCCGHGRHAIPLAQRGYQVTGLDLSEVFLRYARDKAAARGVEVRWVQADMREVPFEGEFDAVLNLFTAFGYLENEAEDQKVLEQVHKALKPGGRFLIELLHREWLMRHLQPAGITHLDDGALVLQERRFDILSSRNIEQVILIDADGKRIEYEHNERVYTATELARMLETAGLRVKRACGGLVEQEPLGLDSHRLVIVSRKPGGDR